MPPTPILAGRPRTVVVAIAVYETIVVVFDVDEWRFEFNLTRLLPF
jgi:hypothetical protein